VSTLWSLLIQANAVYRSTNTSKSPVITRLFLGVALTCRFLGCVEIIHRASATLGQLRKCKL